MNVLVFPAAKTGLSPAAPTWLGLVMARFCVNGRLLLAEMRTVKIELVLIVL